MKCSEIKVIKKDETKEEFNVQKVLAAVNKSANRAMIIFSKAESKFICEFVEEKAEELDQSEVPIAQMHNIVEGALERVNPVVAKSYRDYRNYKQDFVQMLDEVYKKSQSIMYIGDKENSNTDSALVSTKRTTAILVSCSITFSFCPAENISFILMSEDSLCQVYTVKLFL